MVRKLSNTNMKLEYFGEIHSIIYEFGMKTKAEQIRTTGTIFWKP